MASHICLMLFDLTPTLYGMPKARVLLSYHRTNCGQNVEQVNILAFIVKLVSLSKYVFQCVE